MAIYVLIILCIFTILGLLTLIIGISENDGGDTLSGILIFALGVIAIIFQSISL